MTTSRSAGTPCIPSSASASSLRSRGPGIFARLALPGLFLCVGLALPVPPPGGAPLGVAFGVPGAEAAAWQQPPDGGAPSDSVGVVDIEEEEEEEEQGSELVPDSTQFMPAEIGIKPVRSDTTAVKSGPATTIPQSGLPSGGTTGTPATPSARRGVFGLHPVVIVLGLAVAHVFLIKLVTD